MKSSQQPNISKQAALRIGLQVERIVDTMDRQNFDELAGLATQLRSTAVESGAPEIAEVAARLETAAIEDDSQLDQLVATTRELLDLCRDTQRAYLNFDQEPCYPHPVPPAD